MGILVHPNYEDEKANGVGVSTDPIYQTDDTYYLNTQIGEDLVTNPDPFSSPEEILLDRISLTNDDFLVIRYSSLVPGEELIMKETYLDQMRNYLTTIHDEFKLLYNAEGIDKFAMDIEYKITNEDQLIIKQARPWASYWSELEPVTSSIDLKENDLSFYPNPFEYHLSIDGKSDAVSIQVFNLIGNLVYDNAVNFNSSKIEIHLNELPQGIYLLIGKGKKGEVQFSQKLFKR